MAKKTVDYEALINKVISVNKKKVALYFIKNKREEIKELIPLLLDWDIERDHLDIIELLV